ESPLKSFLSEHVNQFEQEKKWGWPLFWQGTIEVTFKYLSEMQVRCFEISSSYGLNGWILATNIASDEQNA
ncbi:MAG: hypothetical protein ABIP64_03650, partial [Burkholderiales bacterium]